uniref:Putative secreted protein n=1 Tax=Anopheles marajoara TaxID=58244 RepID=A0A2M4CCX1_9DIPT
MAWSPHLGVTLHIHWASLLSYANNPVAGCLRGRARSFRSVRSAAGPSDRRNQRRTRSQVARTMDRVCCWVVVRWR